MAAPPLGVLQLKGHEPQVGAVNIRELKEMRDAATYKKEQLDFVGQMKNAHEQHQVEELMLQDAGLKKHSTIAH